MIFYSHLLTHKTGDPSLSKLFFIPSRQNKSFKQLVNGSQYLSDSRPLSRPFILFLVGKYLTYKRFFLYLSLYTCSFVLIKFITTGEIFFKIPVQVSFTHLPLPIDIYLRRPFRRTSTTINSTLDLLFFLRWYTSWFKICFPNSSRFRISVLTHLSVLLFLPDTRTWCHSYAHSSYSTPTSLGLVSRRYLRFFYQTPGLFTPWLVWSSI